MKSILVGLLLAAVSLAQEPAPTPKPPEPAKPEQKQAPEAPRGKSAAKVKSLKVGDTMPSFELALLNDGAKEKSEDILKGAKVLVIDFWSINCPTCRVNESRFEALEKNFKDKGVRIRHVASNRGEVGDEALLAKLKERASGEKLQLPVLVDQGNVLADQFGAVVTPTCYVVDAAGVIRYTGALTDDMRNRKVAVDYLEDAVKAVLEGKSPDITSTRPEG